MTVMHSCEQWILTSISKYKSSKTYIDESRNDPPQEPYKSKYKAKEILTDLLTDFESKWGKRDSTKITAVWGLLKYDLGVLEVETEETRAGCDCLSECWESLENVSHEPQCCILALSVLNQLGILWSGRGQPAKALSFLKQAESIYHNFKKNCSNCPYALEDIFNVDSAPKDDWTPLEKVFTLTLYYLAQVYEHLKDSENSAKYCHITLKRQKESEEFDQKDWAVNSATLSQYYIQENDFVMARHLLSCASDVLSKYEAPIDNGVDDVHRSKAEVAWCWLKYCINLLSECFNGGVEFKDIEPTSRLANDPDVIAIENKVLCSVSSFEEARKVFLFGQNQIKEVKLYFTLNDHANNYVFIVQDHSKLYKQLVLFEKDLGRQSKMHKRRIDMLEDVLSKLNPQYYLAACRQLQFELGETYYEIADLKKKKMNSLPVNQAASAVKKINLLIASSIDNFNRFIDTLKNRDGTFPSKFTDDLVRPTLVAHFYLGRLYLMVIESDVTKRLNNLSKSGEHFQYILDYTEKYPDHSVHMEKELPVVKEMISAMPHRLRVIGSESANSICKYSGVCQIHNSIICKCRHIRQK